VEEQNDSLNVYYNGQKVTMDITCVICFEVLGRHNILPLNARRNYIKCKNNLCHSSVCLPCMGSYIEFSLSDNKIPKCPDANCGNYYVLSDIYIYQELIAPYSQCCFNELLGKHGDEARRKVEIINNKETLRRLRETFVTERFPRAIAFTASVIMPHKLRRLDKQVVEQINEQTNNSTRTCMNLTCGGSLDPNMKCLSCNTQFCLQCERRVEGYHVCNPNDIESVQVLRQLIRCPSCNLPIIRSIGCDHMTCANCGQHFNYITGIAMSDIPTRPQTLNLQTKRLLSVSYHDVLNELGLLNYIQYIEALEPKITNTRELTNIFVTYYKNSQIMIPGSEIDLARAFEMHIMNLSINKRYHQSLNEIETHIINRSLTPQYLSLIYQILSQPIQ
jgi:hypothetical protein